ncbi:MAG: sulfite exporter TauE/SafE family protein, partial [Litorivicinus sp.]
MTLFPDFEPWQFAAISLIFVWSGFVRSGLGFGGAVLSLPFLLWVHNDPIYFLPIIAVHLLVFSSLIMWQSQRKRAATGARSSDTIDWNYLKQSLKIMIVPKLIGIAGLVTLPAAVMSSIIFVIVTVYSVGYILNRPFRS